MLNLRHLLGEHRFLLAQPFETLDVLEHLSVHLQQRALGFELSLTFSQLAPNLGELALLPFCLCGSGSELRHL
ncbi:MAG: hypothetical protein ACRD3I_13875, partial [Terriglobales bacterium]